MSRDITTQLAVYFEYVDETQGVVDVQEVLIPESVTPLSIDAGRHGPLRPLRGWLVAVAAAAAVLLLVGGATLFTVLTESEEQPVIQKPTEEQPVTQKPTTEQAAPSEATEASTTTSCPLHPGATTTGNLRLVAEALCAGSESPLAGVNVHGQMALVGGMSTGYRTSNNVGVRIVDLSDPVNPTLVGRIPLRRASYGENHSHGDAVATHIATDAFVGDVAIVLSGVPDEFEPADYRQPYGVWDITDPSSPKLLSVFNTGVLGIEGGELGDKPPDAKAAAGHYFFTLYTTTDPHTSESATAADLHSHMAVVDLSDPRNPVIVGDWGQFNTNVTLLGLSLNEAATRAYLTGVGPYPHGREAEDGYLFILDVSDPTAPREIGRYVFPLRPICSVSKAVPNADETVAVLLDHCWGDWNKDGVESGSSLGVVHLLDISDLSNIRETAVFVPEEADRGLATDVVVRGNLVFTTWLEGGLRVIDISDPTNPVQVGAFLLPPYLVRPWLSDVALLGDQYVLVTTVWGQGMYVLSVENR